MMLSTLTVLVCASASFGAGEVAEAYELNTGKVIVERFRAQMPSYVADKHYFRKHGAGAYYGQN